MEPSREISKKLARPELFSTSRIQPNLNISALHSEVPDSLPAMDLTTQSFSSETCHRKAASRSEVETHVHSTLSKQSAAFIAFKRLYLAERISMASIKLTLVTGLTFVSSPAVSYATGFSETGRELANLVLDYGMVAGGVLVVQLAGLFYVTYRQSRFACKVGNYLEKIASGEICGNCDYLRAPTERVCSECGEDERYPGSKLTRYVEGRPILRWLFRSLMDEQTFSFSRFVTEFIKTME